MSATIRDVAKRAGVSTATVSRVLNNVGSVGEDTRKRVEKVAAELRYTPSALGRSLSTRKTDALGLVLPDLFGEFFSEVIRGCDQTAQLNSYHLLVSSSHNSRAEIEAALKMMRGRVDGLVIMSPHIDAKTLNANLPYSLPVVLLNCPVQEGAVDSLNVDNFNGALQMVRHLISHGHRRIAIIKGTEHNFDAEERLRGYRSAMREADGAYSEALEFEGNFSEASGYDAVKKMLQSSAWPTGIFASNDAMAIGALSALQDAGVGIPGEIALAGFDDIPIAHYLTPALTTVKVSINELGVRAVTQLMHAVREKNNHKRLQSVLETTLAIRESCGCCHR